MRSFHTSLITMDHLLPSVTTPLSLRQPLLPMMIEKNKSIRERKRLSITKGFKMPFWARISTHLPLNREKGSPNSLPDFFSSTRSRKRRSEMRMKTLMQSSLGGKVNQRSLIFLHQQLKYSTRRTLLMTSTSTS